MKHHQNYSRINDENSAGQTFLEFFFIGIKIIICFCYIYLIKDFLLSLNDTFFHLEGKLFEILTVQIIPIIIILGFGFHFLYSLQKRKGARIISNGRKRR